MIDWFNFATMVLLYLWLVLTPMPDAERRRMFIIVGAVLLSLALSLRVWVRAGHG